MHPMYGLAWTRSITTELADWRVGGRCNTRAAGPQSRALAGNESNWPLTEKSLFYWFEAPCRVQGTG